MIEEKPLPWQELLEIFFRRRMAILGLAALGLVLAFAVVTLEDDVYEAKAKILLTEQAVSGPREEGMSQPQIKAELHHLKSPALVRATLELYQETAQPLRPDAPSPKQQLLRRLRRAGDDPGAAAQASLDARVQEIGGLLNARSIAGTNVIEIGLEGRDPEWSARFVNDLLDQHIKRIAQFNEEARASNFYTEQRNLLFVRWKEAQEALHDFRESYGANLLSGDEDHLRKVLSQLEADRVETETRVLEHQAKVDFLALQLEELPNTIAAESRVTEDESVKLLKQNILALEMERSELLSRFTPTSTRVREVERRIDEARRLLTETSDERLEEVMTAINPAYQTLNLDMVQTEARLVAALARVTALVQQIDEYRAKLNRLDLLATELARLKSDVENKREAHETYLRKEEEARLSSSLDESGIVNLAIFERAETPSAPIARDAKPLLAGGGIGGFILGVLFALIRDFADPRLKGSAQAHRLASAPIVAEVPRG
ncbi:MAG: Wzz/FepE/Etk N-terminal domain-containing protein [Acidobacteriota bacterium]